MEVETSGISIYIYNWSAAYCSWWWLIIKSKLNYWNWNLETDFSWVDEHSLLALIAVVKETPKNEDWMASDLEKNIHEFVEINKKIFLELEIKPLLKSFTSKNASNSQTVSMCSTIHSIVDVLINKTNCFPKTRQNASLVMVKK